MSRRSGQGDSPDGTSNALGIAGGAQVRFHFTDPAGNPMSDLLYTDGTGAGPQHAADPTDSTGRTLDRFLEANGSVVIDDVLFAGGGVVDGFPNAATLDWVGGVAVIDNGASFSSYGTLAITRYTGTNMWVEDYARVVVDQADRTDPFGIWLQNIVSSRVVSGQGADGITVNMTDSPAAETLVRTQGGDDRITVMSIGTVNTGSAKLFGGDGADTITGGAGNDRIDGGAGADEMTGGLGADRFILVKGEIQGDVITDFSVLQGDTIRYRGFVGEAQVVILGDTWTVTDSAGGPSESFTVLFA